MKLQLAAITFALTLASALLASRPAAAYVSYNRLGYVSCNACHYASTGGGMLSAYGRTVGAAMSVWSRETEPEEKAVAGGAYLRAVALDETRKANPFLMQADALATVAFGEKVRVEAIGGLHLQQGTTGFANVPGGTDAFLIRRGLVQVQLDATDSLEFGRESSIAGLNIDDHTAFLRTTNRRNIEDYPTQIRAVRQTEQWQLLPYLFGPSFEESEQNREYGLGFRAERILNANNSVGGLVAYGNSPAIARTSFGAFARLSPSHATGVMLEGVWTLRSVSSGDSFDQQNIYLRPFVAFPEWVETSVVYDFLRVSAPFARQAHQWGPEVNVRLHEFVSLIGDGRQVNSSGRSDWSWYGQLFVHFQI